MVSSNTLIENKSKASFVKTINRMEVCQLHSQVQIVMGYSTFLKRKVITAFYDSEFEYYNFQA
jgi:hypothetical protein